MIEKVHFAIMSGVCASTASMFGKLSWLPALQDHLIVRLVLFTCMVTCNAAVWTLFVKALHQTDSSLSATVISSASNYVCSAIMGFLFFGEVTSFFWWSGMFFILIGLLLILSTESTIDEHHNDTLNKND